MKKLNIVIEFIVIFLLTFGLILLIVETYTFSINHTLFDKSKSVDSDLLADLGSLISGSVGTMWSLASILLLFLTISLQKEDSKNAQIEIENKISQIERQNNQFVQERIETTFFNLLNYHHLIINNLEFKDYGNSKVILKGRDCFKGIYNEFKSNMEDQIDTREIIIEEFANLLNKYQESIGTYFRNLYNIFKYLDNSNMTNKTIFTDILKAQLSGYEIILLYYNCATSKGEKFKKYAIKYELFLNIDSNKLISKDDISLYNA